MDISTQSDAPSPSLTSLIWAMKPGDELKIEANTLERIRSVQATVCNVRRQSEERFLINRRFMTRRTPTHVLIWRKLDE